jgi:hypothetical protein
VGVIKWRMSLRGTERYMKTGAVNVRTRRVVRGIKESKRKIIHDHGIESPGQYVRTAYVHSIEILDDNGAPPV